MPATDSDPRSAGEYILGTDPEEAERLRVQHEVWAESMRTLLRTAGVTRGQRGIDIGCGPGTTSYELGRVVGPSGHLLAVDASERFVNELDRAARERGMAQIETKHASLETIELEPVSYDFAYGRWILSWLPDAAVAVERIAAALRPGGVLILQEYLNWGAMRLLPRHPAHDRGVAACRESWRLGPDGGTAGMIDVAERVPEFAERFGLSLKLFSVNARSGAPGTPVWRWLDGFYETYLPRIAARGLLTQEELSDFFAAWRSAEASATSHAIAPIVADVILEKPAE